MTWRGIWRFVAVGDGCYPLVHQTLVGFGSVYRVAYAAGTGAALADPPSRPGTQAGGHGPRTRV
jgi:hypothetical protein